MTRSTFAIPTIIAVATLLGLVIALTGDGWRDGAGWAGLALPLIAIAWAVSSPRQRRKD